MKKIVNDFFNRDRLERCRKYDQIACGVVYDEDLVSWRGMQFTLFKEPGTTLEMLKKAEQRLKIDRDVVGVIRYVEIS